MRHRIDCAVFHAAGLPAFPTQWLGLHAGGRLQLQELRAPDNTDALTEGAAALVAMSVQLRRYDACLLPVHPANLGWARLTLAGARPYLHTPIIALTQQLRSSAIGDLYSVGVADFLCLPLCHDELRARVEHLLDAQRYPGPLTAASSVTDAAVSYASACTPLTSEAAFCDTILERSGDELDAFAVAAASRTATSKESFRYIKGLVVDRFEKAYITAALGRHAGNISLAARHAQKHRRAFWALMRKHDIDPSRFRRRGTHQVPHDG